ncbi:MAG: hypothetical protein Q4F64_06895 [Corynebacterium casei]|nr:hypothetical protein [Corynebacterium casei]
MQTNEPYLHELARELKRHEIPAHEVEQTIVEVQATATETNQPLVEEFGTARQYVNALYPEATPKQFYLFTLIGLILAAAGFIVLTAYFRNIDATGTALALWKFSPLLLIPVGMAVDFTRYRKV